MRTMLKLIDRYQDEIVIIPVSEIKLLRCSGSQISVITSTEGVLIRVCDCLRLAGVDPQELAVSLITEKLLGDLVMLLASEKLQYAHPIFDVVEMLRSIVQANDFRLPEEDDSEEGDSDAE